MVVDHDVGARQLVAEERRLHIDHRNLVIFVQFRALGRLDIDLEQMDHGAVFRTGDRLEAEQRGGELVAAEQGPQSHRAGHRVGVRIVLQHDRDPIAFIDQGAQFLQFLFGICLIHSACVRSRRGGRACHGDELEA